MEGKKFSSVEMRDARPGCKRPPPPAVLKEIENRSKPSTPAEEEITPKAYGAPMRMGAPLVEGTTVICALGQRARTDVVSSSAIRAPFVRGIGDARRVSTITNAVYQGIMRRWIFNQE